MTAGRGLALDVPMHPTTRAYCDFLLGLTYSGYPAQITAIWALERSYLESWDSAQGLRRGTAREAEDAFFWVTHYERGFWDMAMSG